MSALTDKKISIVVPVYNEEKSLEELYYKLGKILSGCNFEIIFVNDGSNDNSWKILKKLSREDECVKLIDFSRNFGKEIAMSAGLNCARGEAVIIMDADLEHPPELIPEFIKKWQGGYEIVYTVRRYSKETPLFKRASSKTYYFLINKISSVKLEPSSTDFRLLDRKVVDVFNQLTERGRFFRGLIDWLGYRKYRLEFVAPRRQLKKQASYSFKKLWKLAVSGVTSFSMFPLKVAGYLGTLITAASGIFLAVMFIFRWFINRSSFSPISFVIMFNIFLSGVILMCLGFIALYIGNMHNEILNRPLYVVREKINFKEDYENNKR